MKCITGLVRKNTRWLWIAICSITGKVINYEMGGRGIQTGRKLWTKLEGIDVGVYCSDNWKPYEDFIPRHKHIQSKAFTWNIENLNGRIRHYLARFHRKTKCWSKSSEMIHSSLLLLFHKFNHNL